MRVAIIGRGHLGVIALDVLRKLGTVVKVVTNRVEPLWDARLRAHVQRVSPNVELDTSGDWRHLLGADVELILSVMYDRIIGAELIDQTRILNLHLGKLPEYRGMRPVNWALKNGESVAGVTLHEVDEGIDTGPIVAQTTFSIFPDVDEVKDVYGRAVRAAENILRDYMPIIDLLKGTPQDDSRARYYSAADIARLGERTGWTR